MVAGSFYALVQWIKSNTLVAGEWSIVAIGDGVSAIAALGVTFGGFGPTAMDGVEATREQVERSEAEMARKREAARRKRELEMARTSAPRKFEDSQAIWVYVVVDEALVRIVGCETDAEVLELPGEIEGMPVYAIGPDACARLETVREIICCPSLEFIGSCAFRMCPNLERIVFPEKVAEYSSSWVQLCPNLADMTLPGALDVFPASVFDNRDVKRLVIGPNVRQIEPGAFQHAALEEVVISDENPYICTDSIGIYTSDKSELLALALPVSRYEVQNGCRKIAKKACYNVEALQEVKLPEGVEELCSFAFSHTGLRSFEAPSTLRIVGEKSFFCCRNMHSISLNEGLQVIGASAFEESALDSLHIPASIREIGNSMSARTNIVHSGPDCSIEIDAASESLFLDGEGGLYRREEDGVHFIQLIDREATEFAIADGTAFVNDYAFAYHDAIESVAVCEGVRRIGANAFRYCVKLRNVSLPSTIEYLGDGAFIDTVLESLHIPAKLAHIGNNALVTKGAHRGEEMPSLQSVTVDAENERYFMSQGMLCRHEADGDRVVLFTNSEARVAMPESIVGIDQYAFNNARGIEYLSLNKGLRTISAAGLTTWCWIKLIHVELTEPLEGRTEFDFEFPDTPKSKHGISQGIGGATWVHVPGIMAQYDICIATARDYNAPRNPDNISAYEQAQRIIARLQDPILLTPFNRGVFERLLRTYITEICVDVARHDDRTVIDSLVEMGFVNEGNLEDIIMAVGKLQDAAMTGYLLELKRLRFGKAAFDFDL